MSLATINLRSGSAEGLSPSTCHHLDLTGGAKAEAMATRKGTRATHWNIKHRSMLHWPLQGGTPRGQISLLWHLDQANLPGDYQIETIYLAGAGRREYPASSHRPGDLSSGRKADVERREVWGCSLQLQSTRNATRACLNQDTYSHHRVHKKRSPGFAEENMSMN